MSAPAWCEAHAAALSRGEHEYPDPQTGLSVLTELAHRARGWCCGSGCRHCPFGHIAVPAARRAGPDVTQR